MGEGVRAPGPPVRVRHLLEPALTPLPGLRVVGTLLAAGRSDELPSGDPGAGLAARQPAEPDRDRARLRLDRPDLPPARPSRELGLLRLQRDPARLRRQRDVLQGREAEREDPRDLEPAPLVRHRARGRPARRRAAVPELPRPGEGGDVARGVLGHAHPEGQRPPAGADLRRPDLRHGRDRPDHAQPRLGLDRDLPGLGRLGWVLRPCPAPDRGCSGLRPARSRRDDQPVRPQGLHRPPDAELRRLPQVHRGRLHERRPP